MNDTANPDATTRASSAGTEPSVDDLFAVLGDARRRTVLKVLAGNQTGTDVESLATRVAARESDAAEATPSESTVRDVHVTLHHVHLPKLDDAGLVDHDRGAGTVRPTSATDAVPIDIE